MRTFAYGYLLPAYRASPFHFMSPGYFAREGPIWFPGPWHSTNAVYSLAVALALEFERKFEREFAGLNAGLSAESMQFKFDMPATREEDTRDIFTGEN